MPISIQVDQRQPAPIHFQNPIATRRPTSHLDPRQNRVRHINEPIARPPTREQPSNSQHQQKTHKPQPTALKFLPHPETCLSPLSSQDSAKLRGMHTKA